MRHAEPVFDAPAAAPATDSAMQPAQ